MKAIRLFPFACCVLFLISRPVSAQSYYEIEGVIYAPGFKPVPNVVVVLQDQTRSQVAQTITSTDGRYQFNRVAAGTWFIAVRPDEAQFQPAAQRVELLNTARSGVASAAEKVDITLRPAARRPNEALTSETVFAQSPPPEAEAEYKQALESLTKGGKDQAIGRLRHALELFPDYFLANQQLGLIQVEEGKYEQALEPLQKALKLNPKSGPSLLALGIARVNLNQPEAAVEVLNGARQLDVRSFRTNLYLGIALLNLDRLDEAEKSLKDAYALGGSDKSLAHLYLASVYSKRKQYRQAVDELEAYLRETPKAANAANIQQAIKKLKAKM